MLFAVSYIMLLVHCTVYRIFWLCSLVKGLQPLLSGLAEDAVHGTVKSATIIIKQMQETVNNIQNAETFLISMA